MDKILFIHPDPKEREKMISTLEQAGFDIVAASNGEQGIAKIRQRRPNLIVIAETLPLIDGDQICPRIRQVTTIPIIVLGSKQKESAGIEMLESGADVYMTSPLNFKELVARVHSLLRRTKAFGNKSAKEDTLHDKHHPDTWRYGLYGFTNPSARTWLLSQSVVELTCVHHLSVAVAFCPCMQARYSAVTWAQKWKPTTKTARASPTRWENW